MTEQEPLIGIINGGEDFDSFLKLSLEEAGYKTVCGSLEVFSCDPEKYADFLRQKPNALIINVNRSVVDNLKLIEKLLPDPESGIPVIYTSASKKLVDAYLGNNECIAQPFQVYDELIQAVCRAISTSRKHVN